MVKLVDARRPDVTLLAHQEELLHLNFAAPL